MNQKISEIEVKFISDLYDDNKYKLIKNITNYIISTSNSVIYESFSKNSSEDFVQIVEFPICDIDDKVVAIIGFNQKTFKLDELINADSNTSNNIDDIPSLVVLVSNDFVVQSFSNKFYKQFNLNPNSIKEQNLQSIFNIDFAKLMNKESGSLIKIGKNEYLFEYRKTNINEADGFYFSFIEILEKANKSNSSEKSFDMLMYTSPDPMFIYSVDNLKFLKVNDAALKFYGYREDEFLSMDLTDLYAPEDIQTLVESSSNNTLEQGFTGPWRQKKKDGTTVKVEVSKSGIEYNNIQAHFNIIKDISKNLANDKINEQFNLVLENSSDIILITDADGFIKEANESVQEKLGYKTTSLIERSFLSLVADEFRAKINTSIFHNSKKKKTKVDCSLKKEDGTIVAVNLITNPIFGLNKELESFLIIIKNEKEVVIKTVIQQEIIGESNANTPKGNLDTEFLGHLFHELLTPVNVIIGFSQELAENADSSSEDVKEAVDIIKQNQRILLQLMDNAVQYSELEQNKMKISPNNVHFVELIDQIETDIKKTSANFKKELKYGKISSSLVFETDKTKIEILISLLIEFAFRSTKSDRIFLSAYQTDTNHCVIAVKDDRNEISKELADGLNEIFTGNEDEVRHKYGISRFTRRFAIMLSKIFADSTGIIDKYGKKYEFGFTLPIRFNNKKLSEIMKGSEELTKKNEIEPTATSTINEKEIKKNEFEPIVKEEKEVLRDPITLQVNINQQSNPQQNVPQPLTYPKPVFEEVASQNIEVATEVIKEKSFDELSCLYVEDQIDSQILFKVQMKGLKSIEFANSFEKAIPLLQAKKFDFIVMDINLQGEYNGLDALRAIQKMPEHANVPIIAVTAYVLPGDRERFISAGFNDFISKPILRDKLETVLNNIFLD